MNLLTAAGIALFIKRVVLPVMHGFGLLMAASLRLGLLPLVALAGLVRRCDPPPIYRGTHTNSGRPLRTFQDSINDLQATDSSN